MGATAKVHIAATLLCRYTVKYPDEAAEVRELVCWMVCLPLVPHDPVASTLVHSFLSPAPSPLSRPAQLSCAESILFQLMVTARALENGGRER